jgi:diguanylate cyclase (GGDEF)-like protein
VFRVSLVLALLSAPAAALAGDFVYFGAYAVVCGLAVVAAVRHRGPWLWIAGGQVLWIVGDAAWPVAQAAGWGDPAAVQALLWTAGYACYGAALIGMARRRAGRRLGPVVFDMAALTTAVAIAIWVVYVSPSLDSAVAEPLYAYLTVMGPLGDVVIVGGVLLLVFSPGVRGTATRLLLASAVLRVVSDLGIGFIPDDRLAVAVSAGVILLSNALLVSAALHPGAGELTAAARATRTLHPTRLWFLGAGLLTAPAIAFAHESYQATERVALFLATVVCSALILVRFGSAVRSLERAERQLTFQAAHDPLTGLANRAVLTDVLDHAPPRTTVLYLDLDGFKSVNDTAGHAAGDTILREVARRLGAAVRAQDTVARLGGDEFAVVLPGAGAEDAVPLAQRLIRDICMPVEYDGRWYSVGTSIGIATGDSGIPAALLRAADTAMYEAKHTGRGRWVLAAAA